MMVTAEPASLSMISLLEMLLPHNLLPAAGTAFSCTSLSLRTELHNTHD